MGHSDQRVAVLMATYNGDKFIEMQLDSILNQKNVRVTIYIHDDGSNDETIKILEKYKQTYQNIVLVEGLTIGDGPGRSFIELMRYLRTQNASFDFVSFADQDDIWLPNKLEYTITMLTDTDSSLAYGVALNFDSVNHEYSETNFGVGGTLETALFKNNAIGMTVVFGASLFDDLNLSNTIGKEILHDYWVYASSLALGRKVVYIDKPLVLYRQHGANVIGGVKSNLYKYLISMPDKIHKSKFSRHLLWECLTQSYGEQSKITSLRKYMQMNLLSRIRLVPNTISTGNSLKDWALKILLVLKVI